ncbi:MAG: hypothetical protein J3Q66DRAFT_440952 [Benniella sp.]|nr:MAG: hypothetical protein J3Q66DRAFT_440952 [Benniella sp.]
MPQSISSPSIFTSFTITLTFLLCAWSSPSVLAQNFKPTPDIGKCSAFVEGQAFYLLGGISQENFILDLSVPWNTSDPAYKKLEGGPSKVDQRSCAMTNNGEDLFVMSTGVAHIYNVKSGTWTEFSNANFAVHTKSESGYYAVTDPETDIIYLPNGGVDLIGRVMMLSVDLQTLTVNTTGSNPYATSQPVWSTYLKGFVVPAKDYGLMMTFTPSNVTQSSDEWNLLNIPRPVFGWMWDCGASAYGGLMMIFVTYTSRALATPSTVHILDVVKKTWTQGPAIPGDSSLGRESSSCAVSGDHFIVWGGILNARHADTTHVFNIKTNEWVSRYSPPPLPPSLLRPTTTLSDQNLAIIIAAVTGVLLTILLGLIFRYLRRTRQLDHHGSSTGSLGVKGGVNTSGPALDGRLHQGAFGEELVSERPNAIIEDTTTRHGVQYIGKDELEEK